MRKALVCFQLQHTNSPEPKWKTTKWISKRRDRNVNQNKTERKMKRKKNHEQHLQRKIQIVRRLCGLIENWIVCSNGKTDWNAFERALGWECVFFSTASFSFTFNSYRVRLRIKYFFNELLMAAVESFGCTCSFH